MDEKEVTQALLTWGSQAGRLGGAQRMRVANKLASIENTLQRVLAEVQALQQDLEDDPLPVTMMTGKARLMIGGSYSRGTGLFTRGGSVRGIRNHIIKVLEARQEPLTSEQLAEALYVADPKVSFDLFKRRVIVAASAMHRATPPQLLTAEVAGKGKGMYWTLPKTQEATEVTSNDASDERKKVEIAT